MSAVYETVQVLKSTREQIALLAMAWDISEAQVIDRLLATFKASGRAVEGEPSASPSAVPVHAVYEGHRIEGVFDRETGTLTISSGPLAGTSYKSPSGAAVDVVHVINPKVHPNRNGWSFWTVTATGATLQTLRRPRRTPE